MESWDHFSKLKMRLLDTKDYAETAQQQSHSKCELIDYFFIVLRNRFKFVCRKKQNHRFDLNPQQYKNQQNCSFPFHISK